VAPYALQGEGLVTTKGLLQAHHNTLTGMKVKAGLGTREGDARAHNNPGGRRPQPCPHRHRVAAHVFFANAIRPRLLGNSTLCQRAV
jgi:hypothetical protein